MTSNLVSVSTGGFKRAENLLKSLFTKSDDKGMNDTVLVLLKVLWPSGVIL